MAYTAMVSLLAAIASGVVDGGRPDLALVAYFVALYAPLGCTIGLGARNTVARWDRSHGLGSDDNHGQ